MKTSLVGFKSRFEKVEEISNMKYSREILPLFFHLINTLIHPTASTGLPGSVLKLCSLRNRKKKELMKKNEQSLRDLRTPSSVSTHL